MKKNFDLVMRKLDRKYFVNVDFPDENELAFAKRMFTTEFNVYENKLRLLGFYDLEKVLDAGCGFGQWLLPLSYLNKEVVGIDISKNRVNFVNEVLQEIGRNNAFAEQASTTTTIFPSNNFQAIFSYGVVFCTPWKKSLTEFYRILAPGGLLYFNFASIDWYTFLWRTEHNKTGGYSPRSIVAEAFGNYVQYQKSLNDFDGQVIMEPIETESFLRSLGFININIAKEGMLQNNSKKESNSIWGTNGERGIYEITAEKPRQDSQN